MRKLPLLCCLLFFRALSGQDLPSYIRQAEENNPEIQAFKLRFAIAEEKVQETDWLPNTELGAGYFVSEPETRTGAQKARFSVKQMLPWFGTVSARGDYARAMAETGYLDYLIARRKLALQVAQSYYRLYALQASRELITRYLGLLETYERLALTGVEVNRASAVDVLRLQIRQNELEQQREVLREQYTAEQAGFNGLLYRGPGEPVVMATRATLPETDPVLGDSLQLNPELLRFDKLYESVVQEELLNQKERAPAFGVGLDYIPVEKRPDLAFSDNGKDILMPMVTLSIPVFNNRYASRTRQNELRQLELEALKQQRRVVLETALARALSERNAARIRYRTQEENLERARNAEQILLRKYETGALDFNELLEIQGLQVRFEMDQVEAVRSYYEQSALIEYIRQ